MKTNWIVTAFCVCSINVQASDMGGTRETQASKESLTPVERLDVPRYMGTWYEIAKFPNWFQKKCVGNTKAEYSLKDDGTVQIINRCRLAGNEMSVATGTARQVGTSSSPMLKVRFAPAWLSFIPAVWGDYWVIDLDDKYQLVAVSDPSRKFLWILSRTPKVNQQSYEELLDRLTGKGLDVRNLELTKQDYQS